ncbi:MAG: DNA translocase FtsK [Myxococcota bacterium]|nr:DNA translocase FtsK [Myxococcota bacterium]
MATRKNTSRSSKQKKSTPARAAKPKRAPRRGPAKSKADGPLKALTPEIRRALGFLGALAACGFLVLSLFSYSPDDPAISRWTSSVHIENWCGRWGALLADLHYQLLGWAAWSVLPFTGWLWLRFARRAGGSVARLLTGLLGTWWTAVFFGLLFYGDASRDFPAGGVVGQGTAGWLLDHMGTVGAYVFALIVLLASCTVVFGIQWEKIADRAVSAVETSSPTIRRVALDVGAAARVVLLALLKWGSAGVRLLGQNGGEWVRTAIDTRLSRRETLRVGEMAGVEPILGVPIQRMEPDLGFDISHTAVETQAGGESDDLGASLEGVVPTAVAARQMVEVEYVPTSAEDSPDTWVDENSAVVEVDRVVLADGELDSSWAEAATRGQPEAPEESPAEVPSVGTPVDSMIQPGLLESGGDASHGQVVNPATPTTLYELPDLSLLDRHEREVGQLNTAELNTLAQNLTEKLADFGVRGEVTAIRPGPVITIFEYEPAAGVKVSKIAGLTDDIAMAMRAMRVRIVAPIPGRGVVGIEIPNEVRQTVWFRDMLVSDEFQKEEWALPMALGKTVEGRPRIGDLARMPHLLVGGTTGSGKSVGINAMLMTMLYAKTPEELRMILIDPKMLEFEPYQGIPHLLHPVVTEPKLAAAALKWACGEMDARYRLLAAWGTRNIEMYNRKVERELKDWNPKKARKFAPKGWPESEPPPMPSRLPFIVIVIDELADLMMVAAKDVEESIVRLAQKARACGIHLIVATQRPSVDVITGLIKANMPSRIAFQVRSKIDGRTILDQNGAETLLGRGDMLFLPPGVSTIERLHGPFVTDEEVGRVSEFLEMQGMPAHSPEIVLEEASGPEGTEEGDYDEVYDVAVRLVAEQRKASTSMIQRYLKIGYNRAARIMDMMEREGVVGPADGARPREVLVGPPSMV